MPFLENASDYAEDDQLTHTNLNALTESAKPVKAGSGVTNSGNTTDETSCNINSSGEIEVKDAGITTAKLGAGVVTNPKLAPTSGTAAVSGSGGSLTNVVEAASIGNADLVAGGSAVGAVAGSDSSATGSNVIEAGSIGADDLGDEAMSGRTELTTAPADADELFITASSTLLKIGVDTFMEHPAIPQAYGVVTFDGSATLSGGYHVTSVSDPDSSTVRVTLSITMSDTNYVVALTASNTNSSSFGNQFPACVYARTTTTFDIATGASAKASGYFIHFTVFGTRS